MPGILVYGEAEGGLLTTLTKECFSAARKLSDLKDAKVTAFFMGEKVEEAAQEAIQHGADEAYGAEGPDFGFYQPELYLKVLADFLTDKAHDVILMGHSHWGADLGPRLAFRLNMGIFTSCVDLSVDTETGQLIQGKDLYGGNFLGKFSSDSAREVVTIRKKAFPPMARDEARKGAVEIFHPDVDISLHKIKLVDRIKDDANAQSLEEAEVIVSGGRGMETREAFEELNELAEMLGGVIGGSRPACERGWIPSSKQIGLTGEKVGPKLYLAVGISGAIQHIMGISSSKCIVGINKDPDANIFSEADYGAVGDYREILPAFKDAVRERLGKS